MLSSLSLRSSSSINSLKHTPIAATTTRLQDIYLLCFPSHNTQTKPCLFRHLPIFDMSYFPVYIIEYLGAPRNHHAVFVETRQDESGTIFHVKGDIQNGMTYEAKQTSKKPELSTTFVSKSQLGYVRVEDLSRVDFICRANPPPAKQFNGPKRIDKNQPLRRCQEWTNETIENLKVEGVLLDRP